MHKLANLLIIMVFICSMAKAEEINPIDPLGEEDNKPVEAQAPSKTPTNVTVLEVANATIGHYGNYSPFFIGYENNPKCVVKIAHTEKCFKDVLGPNSETIDLLIIMADQLNDTSLARIIMGKSAFNKQTDDGIRTVYQKAKKEYLKFSRSHKTLEKLFIEDAGEIWTYLRMADIYMKCRYAVYSYHFDNGNEANAKKIESEIDKIKDNMRLAERVLQAL